MRLFRSGGNRRREGRHRGLPVDLGSSRVISITDVLTLEQLVQRAASTQSPWTLEMNRNHVLTGEMASVRAASAGDVLGWKALERIFWSPPLGESLWIPGKPTLPAQFSLPSTQLPSFLKFMRRFREWMKAHGLTSQTVLRFSAEVDPMVFLDWPVVEGFFHMMQKLDRWEWTLQEVLDLFRDRDTEILGQWLPQWESLGFLRSPQGITPFAEDNDEKRRKHA